MRVSRVFLVVCGLATLFSCTTEVPEVVVPHPDVVRAELLQAIDSGEPERALQRISALRRESVLPRGELDEYQADAVDRIEAEYESAVDEERYLDAVSALQNLVTLGARTPDRELVSSFYLRHATQWIEKGNAPAALATLLRAPALTSLDPDLLSKATGYARELNNRYALQLLAEALGPAWRAEHPDIVEFAESSARPVEMSHGVVTVWVNRGLRLENGVGIPDRVIGSGFFIDPRGYLVTNYHVVSSEVDPEYEGYSRLYVRLPSDPAERVPARVVGYSEVFDVALLKVEMDAPYVFSFTDIRSLEPGSPILAIGSPAGLENSISSGIISAVGRRFLQMGDAMQVDVPINPGNSGGPLLDRQGRLVGIVFAGLEQYEGVNFAIPSFWVHQFLPDLYAEGRVSHPWMGIAVEQVENGLEVSYVSNDSPADEAGIIPGDVITTIDGWSATKVSSAQSLVLDRTQGSLVALEWTRGEETLTGYVSLTSRPDNPVERALRNDLPERLFPVLFGMRVERLGGLSFFQNYQVTRVYPGSLADETGISKGDRFTQHGFEFDKKNGVVFLRIFVQKRTEGFMRTSLQLPAYVEQDNIL
ncbi:MAG: trypsin-like peptidase domain-containing protein [Spirochaetota bacterium]